MTAWLFLARQQTRAAASGQASGYGWIDAMDTPLISAEVGPARLEVIVADITTLAVDVIANAANTSLLGGGGVDGAIHRAAGPELAREARALAPCPTGEARITAGHRLKARHVIHTVGPIWHGGTAGEPELLAGCYRSSLGLSRERGLETVAFPAISTGVFGYPIEAACRIAVREVADWLDANELPNHVTFCMFSGSSMEVMTDALAALGRPDLTDNVGGR
jgi:O-acetyl-ADP-ribose deacetylase (regulator of RNase III)